MIIVNPRVRDVAPIEGYRLRLTFENDELRLFDCTPYLDFGVFCELKDPHHFSSVRVVDGTVSWPHEQDICPDTLYLESVAVGA